MNLNLGKIYELLASYKGLPFPIQLDPKKHKSYMKDKWDSRQDVLDGVKEIDSLYNRPVIISINLGGVQFGPDSKSGKADIYCQPMMVVSGAKRITKTTLVGGSYNGTVKEFINEDDYTVSIYGVLVNQNPGTYGELHSYPETEVSILKKLWKRNEHMPLVCEVTNDLVKNVVLESLELKEMSKSPGLQYYEIKAVSDGAQEVELLKNENATKNK